MTARDLPAIRPARDDDSAGLIALIDGCFREYPGCVTDVDGEMPELYAIARYAEQRRGRFWIAERNGLVVGSVGVVPVSPVVPVPGIDGQGVELLKLYVSSSERGAGLGRTLVGLVEDEARKRNAGFVELWSDTRFTDAHRLYELLGYIRSPFTRDLNDKSNTTEYHYRKVF
jgi:putative acetyltransferase